MNIKIGTRGSKLALWQAEYISSLLQAQGMNPEIVIIETKGDKILDVALSKIGSKGVFTEEIEEELRRGSIDIAVHSAKDVQSHLPDDLELIAFTEREKANDVLVSFKKDITLKDNIVVGTSSTRRIALLKHYYPHIQRVDMRGNLQTRFKKLEDGQCDAMILAYAGVHRMGLSDYIISHLPMHRFVPPVGQGAVAIQSAKTLDQKKKEAIANACNHEATSICLKAERAYLKKMNGGCSVPVYGKAEWVENRIRIFGGIISLDGSEKIEEEQVGDQSQPEMIGDRLATNILQRGGDRILKEIKSML